MATEIDLNQPDMWTRPADLSNVGATPVSNMGPGLQSNFAQVMNPADGQAITIDPRASGIQSPDTLLNNAQTVSDGLAAEPSAGGGVGELLGGISRVVDETVAEFREQFLPNTEPAAAAPAVDDVSPGPGELKNAGDPSEHVVRHTAEIKPWAPNAPGIT